ncbi:MAG TPA: hypothetical protein VG983_08730 [Caulobacterales bacterium]|jgi:hypothetical protein|nr:hypothetical protein [Caulobacterales bacterium]
MGVVVGRVVVWRQYLALAVALIAALVTFVAAGKAIKVREEEPRVRQIDNDATFLANANLPDLARAASLWLDGRGLECRIAALYDDERAARFAPILTYAENHAVTLAPGWAAHVTLNQSARFEDALAA